MMTARFGAFFRQRRKTLDLSLREFCRRNGFDPGNISRLERGLLAPPRAAEILESYAKALKLEPESREWQTLFDLAATETGRLPRKVMENRAALERLPQTLLRLSDQRTRSGPWTKATHLELWACSLDARAQLPQLIRRLIHATIERSHIPHLEFPAYEGIQRPGWDGIVATTSGNAFVPSGVSVWEMGVDKDSRKKAEEDFRKRTKNPLGLDPTQITFIFVTPRKWQGKNKWREEKTGLEKWKDVRVYDSANLEEWLETAYAVDIRMARLLGFRPEGVIDIEEHWGNLSALTEPSLKPEVFLTSREKEITILEEWLNGPPSSLAFEAPSPAEVIDFLTACTASREDSERDKIESRIVIVANKDQWHVLCTASNHLLLIPKPHLPIEAEMVAEAVRQGHYVLLSSHRFAGEYIAKHELSRPSRHELEKSLIASGVNEEKASQLAREAGGSLSVVKRRLARFLNTSPPEWSQPSRAAELAAILLAGGWDDANVEDRTIIAKLAGRPYDEVLTTATRWLVSEDPPLMNLLTHWFLVSHEDSWLLLAQYITRPQLDLFEEVSVEVLGEDDPRYDLPLNERWYATLQGKPPKYSSQLRTGIAETLALLGAKSEWMQGVPQPARHAEHVVQRLLTKSTSWKRWASLGSLLPVLAEAAPEVFRDAIEADLCSKEPQLPKLLADEGAPLLSSCLHAGLLWASEILAWNPSLLTRVSLALARLAQLDPGGRWANRPIASLQKIFLPWLPQTTGSLEQRIKALKGLTQKIPDVGWQLLLNLLPTLSGSSNFTPRPRWRDWALNWTRQVTDAEHRQQVDACAELLVDLVGVNMDRWIQVIEKFRDFPLLAQDRLIGHLKAFDVGTLDTIARKRITDELRATINKHRSFPDAWWVLPIEKLDELEAIKERFEPQDFIARYSWLFTTHPSVLTDLQDSWEQRQEKLLQLRRDAVCEIFDRDGMPGVFDLMEASEEPEEVGFAFGKARLLDTDSSILPALLLSENQKNATFAIGYGQGRLVDVGWEWLAHLELNQWTAEQSGCFLAFVPFAERKTWGLVEQLGAEVIEQYWSRVFAFRFDTPPEDVEYAISMLLKYNRPFQAVRMLEMISNNDSDIASSLLMDVLEAGLKQCVEKKTEEATANQVGTEIQQIFRRLQADPNVDSQRLATLEWSYLGFLNGYSASPKTLFRLLRTEPRLFAELVNVLYRPEKEPEVSDEMLTEEQKARTRSAVRLLAGWKSVPGLRDDNTVDEEALLAWVTEARGLCEESGLLEVCDRRIGEVLAYAPAESDGAWPCIPIRDVIEDISSADLERGFEIGIFNKRGVVTRSPLVGGDSERQLGERYTSHAEACAIEWPRTASALQRIARHYEEYARREDEGAKWRALK